MTSVIYEKRDNIACITLDGPDALNAITLSMAKELARIWCDIRDDDSVWAAIVTGAGDKAFSAGYDLKEISGGQEIARREGRPYILPVLDLSWPTRGLTVWKPIIAAVNGLAYGGGMELALACDIRIAAEHSRFAQPEVCRALIPGGGGTQRLPRTIPFGVALEILMTGEPITAYEAYRLGLVNRVVPAGELMEAADRMAKRINENGPLAVRAIKQLAYQGIQGSLENGLLMEATMLAKLMCSQDADEGPRAFAKNRKPRYSGR